MLHDHIKFGCRWFAILPLALMALSAATMWAQDEQVPKSEVFVGYQWLDPRITVPTPFQPVTSPVPFLVPSANGVGAAYAYNFNKYLGLELDLGGNWNKSMSDSTVSAGPRLSLRDERMNFFIHGLMGGNRFNVYGLTPHNGIGAIFGGGIDIKATRLLSIRLFEADYVWAPQDFARNVSSQFGNLRHPQIEGARIRGGVVFNFYEERPVPPSASCTVQPSEVLVGEPLSATAAASNFNPKHTLVYNWSSTGGKVAWTEGSATMDTHGVAGGNYTVSVRVNDPKSKKVMEATCSANFTLKEPPKNPPTMSVVASPTTVPAGGAVTLSATCTSPDNVPITVAGWTTTKGSLSANGNSATLNTAGAPAGTATVEATCTDSRGLASSASTQFTVEPPPPPPVSPEIKQLEARLALHSVYFPTAQPAPEHPDSGLLASQQKTLLTLAADFQKYLQVHPEAHLVLEGHADPRGSVPYNQALSERRVERAKSFLVEHGVPAASLDTKAFGAQHNLTSAQVQASVEHEPGLTSEERTRIARNMKTIILASNRRVDITLTTTGETSAREYPFNAADSLTLIGGREGEAKPRPKKPVRKK